MQRVRVVSHHIQAAAICRTFRAERRNDYVAADFDGSRNLLHIRGTVARIGQEVK